MYTGTYACTYTPKVYAHYVTYIYVHVLYMNVYARVKRAALQLERKGLASYYLTPV